MIFILFVLLQRRHSGKFTMKSRTLVLIAIAFICNVTNWCVCAYRSVPFQSIKFISFSCRRYTQSISHWRTKRSKPKPIWPNWMTNWISDDTTEPLHHGNTNRTSPIITKELKTMSPSSTLNFSRFFISLFWFLSVFFCRCTLSFVYFVSLCVHLNVLPTQWHVNKFYRYCYRFECTIVAANVLFSYLPISDNWNTTKMNSSEMRKSEFKMSLKFVTKQLI